MLELPLSESSLKSHITVSHPADGLIVPFVPAGNKFNRGLMASSFLAHLFDSAPL